MRGAENAALGGCQQVKLTRTSAKQVTVATHRCTRPRPGTEGQFDTTAAAFDVAPVTRGRLVSTGLLRLAATILLAPLVGIALVAAAIVTSIVAALFPTRR